MILDFNQIPENVTPILRAAKRRWPSEPMRMRKTALC